MAQESMPPRYIDLSDARHARFGVQCSICAARYATPPTPAHTEDAHRAALADCDTAWRELQANCPYCERPACPACWDSGFHMCIECAEERGLTRTPPTPPSSGPLADGRLALIQPGKYSSMERPDWVGDLLAARADAGPRYAEAAGQVEPGMFTRPGAGDPEREAHPDASLLAGGSMPANTIVDAPTQHMPTSSPASMPLPPPSLPPTGPLLEDRAHIPSPEGAITSNMIKCPRCDTLNYDFVTRCSVCQLQLIQLCPRCERLNSGQAMVCEACGAPLTRPPGWSGAIVPQPPAVERAFQRELLAGGPPELRGSSVPSQPRAPVPSHPSQPPTPVLPYMPNIREYRTSDPAYTPGARSPASSLLPATRDRRNRRRSGTATPALPPGILSTAATTYLPPELAGSPEQPQGRLSGLISAILDRLASLVLLLIILVVAGSIAAAELSPSANAALRGLIHVDIRQTLAHFGDQLRMLLQHAHH
jgi:hypothetical protein